MKSLTGLKIVLSLVAAVFLGLAVSGLAPVAAQTGGWPDSDSGPGGFEDLYPPELDPGSRQADRPRAAPNSVCTIGTWQAAAPINNARYDGNLTYAGFNGRFYLVGGIGAYDNRNLPIEEYDPLTNTWTNKANLLTGVTHSGAAAVDQYIYIPGGYNGVESVSTTQRYNILSNTLTTVAPLPTVLMIHSVVAFGNHIHVLGGSDTGAAGTTHYAYNVATNTWHAREPLPVAARWAAAVSDGDYIYVMGSNHATDDPTVQRYNPVSDSWLVLPSLAGPRHASEAFFDGRNVWVAGGVWLSYLTSTEYWDGTYWQAGPTLNEGRVLLGAAFGNGLALTAGGTSNGDYLNTAERLAVDCPPLPPPACVFSDWRTINPVNHARSRGGLAYAAYNGRFYLAGGENVGGRNLPIEEYNPVTGLWSVKSHLLTGVSNVGVAAAGSFVYVPGGFAGIGGVSDLQRYDIRTNSMATLAPMPAANHSHAVVIQGQKLYVLGGSPTGVPGFTNYIYDITNNTWSSGSPMLTAVNYPAAASDGKYIYVMGGNTSNLYIVQRYDPATNIWTDAPIMDSARGGASAFFDGLNLWAVGGGYSSYLNSSEYFDGHRWRRGPVMNVGVRTHGAAFGRDLALKASGWNGGYTSSAEVMEISCQRSVYLAVVVR